MNAKLSVLYIALAVSLLTESCVAAAQESTRLVLECEARLLLSGFAGPAQVGSERLEIWSDGSFRGARFGLVAEPKRDSWEGRISNSAMKLLESPPEGPPAMSPFATQYGRGFEGGANHPSRHRDASACDNERLRPEQRTVDVGNDDAGQGASRGSSEGCEVRRRRRPVLVRRPQIGVASSLSRSRCHMAAFLSTESTTSAVEDRFRSQDPTPGLSPIVPSGTRRIHLLTKLPDAAQHLAAAGRPASEPRGGGGCP